MSNWDIPGIVDRLRELVADPKTGYNETAEILNQEFGTRHTKNSCIGKSRRLGVWMAREKRLRLQSHAALNRKPSAPNGFARAHRIVEKRKSLVELFGVIKDGVVDLPPDRSPFAVSFDDVKNHHCRWPVTPITDGLFLFCGDEKVEGYSYCTRHCFLAYERPRSERRAAA